MKQETSMDDIVEGRRDLQAPEEGKEQRVENLLQLDVPDEIMNYYEQALKLRAGFLAEMETFGAIRRMGLQFVLTPEQINNFVQMTIPYGESLHYIWNTGMFVSRLMQDSVNAGYRRFCLNTEALTKPIEYIGYRLNGDGKFIKRMLNALRQPFARGAEGKLELRINGGTGRNCCEKATNITLNAETVEDFCCNGARNVVVNAKTIGDYCCYYAKHATINAESIGSNCGGCGGRHVVINAKTIGNGCGWGGKHITVNAETIGDECGDISFDMKITAKDIGKSLGRRASFLTARAETIGDSCGESAEYSEFTAARFGYGCGTWAEHHQFLSSDESGDGLEHHYAQSDDAKRCTFKTTDRESLRRLTDSVIRGRKNSICFLHPDGIEEHV